jgi:4a-hydroxytetrahydrobiopterin dehydratase
MNERAEVDRALAARPRWRRDGDGIVRELRLRDFDEAFSLLERVAHGADDHGRRPDMCVSEQSTVRLTIANPHHAGITLAEVRLAARTDAAIGDVPAETGA